MVFKKVNVRKYESFLNEWSFGFLVQIPSQARLIERSLQQDVWEPRMVEAFSQTLDLPSPCFLPLMSHYSEQLLYSLSHPYVAYHGCPKWKGQDLSCPVLFLIPNIQQRTWCSPAVDWFLWNQMFTPVLWTWPGRLHLGVHSPSYLWVEQVI
jgi:hypothetical protein